MATAAAAALAKCEAISKGVYAMDWTVTAAGVGNPFVGPYADWITVQMFGPTGGDSNIIIEGTNGSVVSTATWVTLESVSGESISLTNVTGGRLLSLREIPRMIRPNVTSVTGPAMVVKMLARMPLR